jgi:hypothetical protein
MKEFTKSLFSYSLAITLFGFKQIDNMLGAPPVTGPNPKAPVIRSLDTVTNATTRELGDSLKAAYQAVDELQRGFVEFLFSALPFATPKKRRQSDLVAVVAEPRRWTESVENMAEALPDEGEPTFTAGRRT